MESNKNIDGAPFDSLKAHDADEMAQALKRIPESYRERIFYMLKGIELMGEQPPPKNKNVG